MSCSRRTCTDSEGKSSTSLKIPPDYRDETQNKAQQRRTTSIQTAMPAR